MNESQRHNGEHESIITRYYQKIAAFVYRRVKSHEDGEDILQNVFYQLAKTDELALPVDQALPWLFRVAKNMITDFFRKRKGVLFSDVENDSLEEIVELLSSKKSDEPEVAYLQDVFWEELQMGLAELPLEQREVFVLTEFENMSYRDIAAQTGININTLLSRKRYATEYLRKHLQNIQEMIIDE